MAEGLLLTSLNTGSIKLGSATLYASSFSDRNVNITIPESKYIIISRIDYAGGSASAAFALQSSGKSILEPGENANFQIYYKSNSNSPFSLASQNCVVTFTSKNSIRLETGFIISSSFVPVTAYIVYVEE